MTERFYKLPKDITARKDLTASDKLVFAVIRNYQGAKDFCWPGIRTLSRDTGLSTVTIIQVIKRLELAGLLVVERLGIGKGSRYSIAESGKVSLPVKKTNRSKKLNTTVKETSTEPVKFLNHIRTRTTEKTHTAQFEQARKIYPGTKRGLQTEFENFKKHHRDWRTALPLLLPAIERQSKTIWLQKEIKYIPNFATWINQRRWEIETPQGTSAVAPFDQAAAAQREKMLAGVR